MKKRSQLVLAAMFAVIALLATSVPVAAVTLLTIRGHVRDASGTPIAGARVSDGFKSVLTDSTGAYALEEEQIATYVLVVTKTSIDPTAPRTVQPVDALSPVDFTVKYKTEVALTPQSFNNDPAKTLDIALKSYAPPTSCATWSTGAVTLPLTLTTSVPGGQSVWTGSHSVPPGTSDGSYSYSAVVKSCSTGAALTRVVTGVFVVDSIAPVINSRVIFPASGRNTVFGAQPLTAQVTDSGSGVDPLSIEFDLTDDTASTTITIDGADVSYNATTKLATTTAATLPVGHEYTITVRASDLAGNAATYTQERDGSGAFRRIDPTVPALPEVSVPRTACDIDDASRDLVAQTKTATCRDVPMHIDAFDAQLVGGSKTAGEVLFTVLPDLSSAKVTFPIAGGIDIEDTRSRSFDIRPQTVRGETVATNVTTTVRFAEVNTLLGDLEIDVPIAWSGTAHLQMSGTSHAPVAGACPVLVVGLHCTPDTVFTASAPVWDPPRPTSHIGPCDAALAHRPKLLVNPNSDVPLEVQVGAGVTATSAELVYRVDGGPASTIVNATPGQSTYAFVIPDAAVGPGQLLQYAFVVSGSHPDARCSGRVLSAPTAHSYTVLADLDPEASALHGAATRAISAAIDQPGFDVDTPPQTLCTELFAAPTPCDLMPASSDSSVPPVPPLDPPAEIQVAAAGWGDPGSCRSDMTLYDTVSAHDELQWYDWVEKYESNGLLGSAKVLQTRTEGGQNDIRQEVFAARTGLTGHESASGKGRVGWRFVLKNLSGPPSSASYHIDVGWVLTGELSVVGGDHIAPLRVFLPQYPLWLAGINYAFDNWDAVTGFQVTGAYENLATGSRNTLNGIFNGERSSHNDPIWIDNSPVYAGSPTFRGTDQTLYDWSPTVEHEYVFYAELYSYAEAKLTGYGYTVSGKTDFYNPTSEWRLRSDHFRLTSADGGTLFCQ